MRRLAARVERESASGHNTWRMAVGGGWSLCRAGPVMYVERTRPSEPSPHKGLTGPASPDPAADAVVPRQAPSGCLCLPPTPGSGLAGSSRLSIPGWAITNWTRSLPSPPESVPPPPPLATDALADAVSVSASVTQWPTLGTEAAAHTVVLYNVPVGARVGLRVRRDGDRFHPVWRERPIKLKSFLSGQKVPLHERDAVPIITVWPGPEPGLEMVQDRHAARAGSTLDPSPLQPLLYKDTDEGLALEAGEVGEGEAQKGGWGGVHRGGEGGAQRGGGGGVQIAEEEGEERGQVVAAVYTAAAPHSAARWHVAAPFAAHRSQVAAFFAVPSFTLSLITSVSRLNHLLLTLVRFCVCLSACITLAAWGWNETHSRKIVFTSPVCLTLPLSLSHAPFARTATESARPPVSE